MSDTTSAPERGARAVRAGLLATALAALTAVGFAPSAGADFTSPKCGGANLNGNGASFAKGAQEAFNFNFKLFYCPGTLNVAYNADGSSAGIKGAQLRTSTSRFWGSDDPPTPAQVALINSGGVEVAGKVEPDTNPANDGKVHVIPIAAGAIAPLVNFPEGCNPEALADKYRTVSAAQITGNAALKGILRVRFTKKLFEEVWAGQKNAKWSEAFPELAAQGAPCEVPVVRVVRFDGSGTTFGFKDYLNTIDPAGEWLTKYQSGTNGNREWPGAEFGSGGQCGATSAPGKGADATDFLTSGCANGNGELVKKLSETDGSIGYSDIATARNASTGTLAVNAALATAPTTPYWTQAQNGSVAVGSPQEDAGQGFTEPTFDEANGFKTTAATNPLQKGSNCKAAGIFKGIPATTTGDWSKTSGVNATAGFGICTLTYALVFDDNAVAFGNTPEEEGKARTLKDYEEYIVHGGQEQLFAADYAPLPADLLAIAQAGVGSIGWNKTGGGGGTPGGGTPGGGNPGTPGGGGGPAPVVISNQFSIPKKAISSKNGSATFTVKLPGAGKLGVLGTAKAGKKSVKVGTVTLTVGKAGTYAVTLKPTGAAKQLLAEKGSLKVNLTFTFSPTGGVAKTTTSAVTLKLVKKGG